MQYSSGDLDMLEAFFNTIDFGKGFDFHYKHATMEVNRQYVDERLRLLRLNVTGPKNEEYGLAWFEVLLALKEHLSDNTDKI
jgi:hypothetical protein